jgi:hypothetical protein
MNDQAEHPDQADEDVLAYTISDEALEAAAGTERGPFQLSVQDTLRGGPFCC